MKKVLVTCPPMLGLFNEFVEPAKKLGLELVAATTTQVLSEEDLKVQLPAYDGWIIGDDPATRQVFITAQQGNLKAAVKWGIGIDNVDLQACKDLDIPIINTPNMFGGEVADVAIGYLLGLARQTYYIDREIRQNNGWPKPAGMSVAGKKVGVVGFGDIGKSTVKRLSGFDVKVTVYDPGVEGCQGFDFVKRKAFPVGLEELDFLIFTCSLNIHNRHMLNVETMEKLKQGVQIINVARGPLIDEQALVSSLQREHIRAVALDVFEEEPLPKKSLLRDMSQCIFGSHNGSNTVEGVRRASYAALEKLAGFLQST
jgi:D-3-phosphoglycerate dehydrogenase